MRAPRSAVHHRAILMLLALLSPTLGAHAPQQGGLRQTTTIVGRVSDPVGRPISGVSVAVAARTSAAATDADGRYALRVDRESL